MIHIRIDNDDLNVNRKFACGATDLPIGDTYFFEAESAARKADCPGCNPHGPQQLGTPISMSSGQPGHKGYREFCRIAESWGY